MSDLPRGLDLEHLLESLIGRKLAKERVKLLKGALELQSNMDNGQHMAVSNVIAEHVTSKIQKIRGTDFPPLTDTQLLHKQEVLSLVEMAPNAFTLYFLKLLMFDNLDKDFYSLLLHYPANSVACLEYSKNLKLSENVLIRNLIERTANNKSLLPELGKEQPNIVFSNKAKHKAYLSEKLEVENLELSI